MADKSFFIDTTRCTACRGCQTACKQWNRNRATKTVQRGTYQNPADLSAATFKLVRFQDIRVPPGEEPKWHFFPDQCRHCVNPLCKMVADGKGKGAILHDGKTGAVVFSPEVKTTPDDFREIREICPFDIPRYDGASGAMRKCTMCIDRIREGMLPACVKTCPTGAMNFGDRETILDMAAAKFDEVKKVHKGASLLDADSVRVIFLLKDDPDTYHQFAAKRNGVGGTGTMAFRRSLHPRSRLKTS
ncbi:formate dehydrogenase [bacterium]|nr:formate dehydrogenase [bacterium]